MQHALHHDSLSRAWWDRWRRGEVEASSLTAPLHPSATSSAPASCLSFTPAPPREQQSSSMAFHFQAGPSPTTYPRPAAFAAPTVEEAPSADARPSPPQFDIVVWYPRYQSCHRYFLDHAQHSGPVQALAAFINIKLPFQKQPSPVMSASSSSPRGGAGGPDFGGPMRQPFSFNQPSSPGPAVSLVPYIRRLIATGHDSQGVLHGFFGDDWKEGIGAMHEIERRNYLFAAKSTSWLKVKQAYDMSPDETCPFLSPLRDVTEAEIQSAESTWSEWLAMQDWMLGPRAPESINREPRVKREAAD